MKDNKFLDFTFYPHQSGDGFNPLLISAELRTVDIGSGQVTDVAHIADIGVDEHGVCFVQYVDKDDKIEVVSVHRGMEMVQRDVWTMNR